MASSYFHRLIKLRTIIIQNTDIKGEDQTAILDEHLKYAFVAGYELALKEIAGMTVGELNKVFNESVD